MVATAALATVLAPLNSTMIIVALPSIARSLHSSLGAVSWLVTSYLIVMAAVQPIAGKLGDRMGRRPLVLTGLIYFAMASAAATFAPNLPLLITFRVQQAIAAALCLPNVAALVRELTPRARRGAVFGVIGGVTGIGAAAGPTLGGVLTQAMGWQAIFSVNLLPVAAALALSVRSIPRLRRSSSLPGPTHLNEAGGTGYVG